MPKGSRKVTTKTRTKAPASSPKPKAKPSTKATKPAKAKAAPKRVTKKIDTDAKHFTSLCAHDLADLLPEMSPAEFQSLKEDIARTKGNVDPIILLDGKILDGRHRHRACVELGLTPLFKDFDAVWGSPISYIYSKAQHRNLNDGQKACAAAKIEPHFAEEAAARRNANLAQNAPIKVGDELRIYGETMIVKSRRDDMMRLVKKSDAKSGFSMSLDDLESVIEPDDGSVPEPVPGRTPIATGEARDQAGALFGVSGRYVGMAKELLKNSPEHFERAFKGEVMLTVATREYRSALRRTLLEKKAADLPPVNPEHAELVVGDNLDVFPTLPRRKYRMAFEDGQYNIGVDYGDGGKSDKRDDKEFLKEAETRFAQYPDLLAPDGSLWVLIGHEYAAEYVLLLKKTGLHLRGWITWYETFGTNCTAKFNRTSRFLLYFTRSRTDYVFHPEAFKKRSWRQDNDDARACPEGKIWDDVWQVPRLVENAKERIPGFPTQLPEELLLAIVKGCTAPGDHVLDGFNGSGTTGAACLRTGRYFTGVEIRKQNAKLARARWATVAAAERTQP